MKNVTTTSKAAKTTRVKQAPVAFYALVEGARPKAGASLYAHTHAALTFFGLLAGKSVFRKAVEAVMGHSAVEYHIKRDNFGVSAGKVKLTQRGAKNFKARVAADLFDTGMADAYAAAFATGAANVKYGIQKEFLVPIRDVVVA